jgi:hypothetical protein
MAPAAQIFLSGVLTVGVPLALAVRELVVVHRRPQAGPPDDQPPPPPPRPTPPIDMYTRPLPACLIPQRRTERTLETV